MSSDPAEKPVPYLEDPTGREHLLAGESVTIGRAAGNKIVITSKRVSREHARIRRDQWRRILEDLDSTNGTFLNNERIVTGRELRDRDRIKIGDVMFTFHDPDMTYSDSVFPDLEFDASAGVVR